MLWFNSMSIYPDSTLAPFESHGLYTSNLNAICYRRLVIGFNQILQVEHEFLIDVGQVYMPKFLLQEHRRCGATMRRIDKARVQAHMLLDTFHLMKKSHVMKGVLASTRKTMQLLNP